VQALQEYANSLELNADWPASNIERGNLLASRGQVDEGRRAYERAIALDPRLIGGYVNLADFERQTGNDTGAEQVLRRGLTVMPQAADLRHALGLTLVRRGARDQALIELAAAAEAAPDNARYAYVQAVALQSMGRLSDALKSLEAFNSRQPDNVDVLSALVSFNRDAGRPDEALRFARQLQDLGPTVRPGRAQDNASSRAITWAATPARRPPASPGRSLNDLATGPVQHCNNLTGTPARRRQSTARR